MPALDWSWLAGINLLQVAIVIVALWVIFRLLMRFWPWLKKVIFVTDSIARVVLMADTIEQLPAFIERTDKKLEEVHHEVHYNNGSSVKDAIGRAEDAIGRVELGVKGLYDRADASDRADAEIRADLERTKPPARKRATKPKEQS